MDFSPPAVRHGCGNLACNGDPAERDALRGAEILFDKGIGGLR
jgi:hypothetical protein